MANFQFPCPACTQTIECDTQYAGMDLTCPICQSPITAPAAAAAPPAAKKGRLSVTLPAQSHQSAPPPPQTIAQAPKRPIKKGPIIQIAAAVIIIPIIIYFLWPYAVQLQNKFSASLDKSAEGSDGGQVGAIADLYSVLDATDPVNFESRMEDFDTSTVRAESAPRKPALNLPSIPPVYTLDFDESDIPMSQVNGSLSGADFVPDLIRFDRAGQTYVLHMRQGTNAFPDRELFIYLKLKAGQSFEANTFEVTKEFQSGAPQIVKKWRTGPRLFGQKNFSTGYMMKLEFEKVAGGGLPGKIYIALPDPEKTVVAGHFIAETGLFDSGQQ
ncbi:MAG: hypothetical protein H0X66_21020 [Verrucomicrobia bacterium]|nr:hypothetical protein [Verrucomicrobiota bacterium]